MIDVLRLRQRFPLKEGSAEHYWFDTSVIRSERPTIEALDELLRQWDVLDGDSQQWLFKQCEAATGALHVKSHLGVPRSAVEETLFGDLAQVAGKDRDEMEGLFHHNYCERTEEQ